MSQVSDDEGLLQAHIDGELDPASAAAFERRLAAEPGLRAQHDSLLSLRRLVRSIPADDVPLARLRTKIDATVNAPEVRRNWRALAAAALIGAVIGAAATFVFVRSELTRETSNLVVTNHIRGLLAPQPFDIASSDRHTIKPWFTSRLPESPPIVDLSGDGFTLVGGRVDVIGTEPVATVVYRHGGHTLSLTTLRGNETVLPGSVAGYNVRTWHAAEFTYVLVADLPDADLEAFRRAFVAGLAP
ncbi:MAG TPA: anti-sigma factor [Xanthobacteraceae bacterium]|nr:anti-sigma factor [Xanthobacteraceae bacterium]